MTKLTELFDPIGWSVSVGGNKTRVKKSFYLRDQQKYISPWFPLEKDATRWFNDRVLKNRKPQYVPTMTLYEAIKDAKVNLSNMIEGRLRKILYKANETGQISRDDIDIYVEPILEMHGEKVRERFYEILEKYEIEIIEPEKKKIKEQHLDSNSKCAKCGSKELSSGYYSKIKKFDAKLFKSLSRDEKVKYMKDFEFAHKCLDCGEMIWTGKPATLFEDYGYGELKVQAEDDNNHVKFHYDKDGYIQENDYSDIESSDYKEQADIDNLINYYIKTLGANKNKIKNAIERSRNPLKQKLLFQLDKMEDDDLTKKLFEMSGVGGVAGFNSGIGDDNSDIYIDNKNIRHRKKNKIIRKNT